MPKEIIRGVLDGWMQGEGDGVLESPERPQVEVRWTGPESGGMHVQLVTKVVDLMGADLPRERAVFPKANAARQQIRAYEAELDLIEERAMHRSPQLSPAAGVEVVMKPDYKAILDDVLDEIETGGMISHRGAIPCNEGYYVTLDRNGLNDLIRAARRARDKSFGKDA